jgi:hypothetical protein
MTGDLDHTIYDAVSRQSEGAEIVSNAITLKVIGLSHDDVYFRIASAMIGSLRSSTIVSNAGSAFIRAASSFSSPLIHSACCSESSTVHRTSVPARVFAER